MRWYKLVRKLYMRSGLQRLRVTALRLGLWLRRAVTNQAGVKLYLDPRDPRAFQLYVTRGAKDVTVVKLWKMLVSDVAPSVVLDVGANYGEVAFSTEYPDDASVHLVEANPRVIAKLRRTALYAPCVTVLHEGAASDSEGVTELFRFGRSSGLSTISLDAADRADDAVSVPTFRLDQVIFPPSVDCRMVFKLDVEGCERRVLDGMKGLLRACGDWVGIVEIENMPLDDVKYLARSYSVSGVHRATLSLRQLSETALVSLAGARRSGLQTDYAKDVVVRPQGSDGP